MTGSSVDSQITIIGAGPYGLSAAAYLRAAGREVRVFGQPMSFWQDQMPRGMCLRSSWSASHIADPEKKLTLDAFCREKNIQFSKPIPLEAFVGYGQWFQSQAVPDLDRRSVRLVESDERGFRITLADGETFVSRRVVVATGIQSFQARPPEFARIPAALVSHSGEHNDLEKFRGKSVAVVGAGQSALEYAALLREVGAGVEVICRRQSLRWVGLHPQLHHLGLASKMLYSPRDVGPAGISRLVAAPHVFKMLPRWIQNRTAYRAIRPAVAGWLKSRIADIPISFGLQITAAEVSGDRLRVNLSDGTERLVDHVLLATGYRVNIARYDFLAPSLMRNLKVIQGYPILKRGLESSVAGLHILGKPAAYSFGPIVGFVSGTEFASTELLRVVRATDSNGHRKN